MVQGRLGAQHHPGPRRSGVRRAAAAFVVAGLSLLGCGDDGEPTTGSAEADPEAVDTTAAPGEGLEDAGDCADAAEEQAPAEALTAFPDNPDVTWTVLDARAGGLGTVLVELEPDPDEVGYPSFTFVYGCGTGEPERLATYALDGGEYVLLSTTDAATDIELAPVLEE